MKTLFVGILLLALCSLAAAQGSRNVDLSWTASTSTGVTGYNVYRCSAPCTPTIGTPLNSALIATTSYVDTTAVIGQTYTYAVAAVAPACTPNTPTTTPCGQSALSTPTSTTVPPQPAITVTVTVSVP